MAFSKSTFYYNQFVTFTSALLSSLMLISSILIIELIPFIIWQIVSDITDNLWVQLGALIPISIIVITYCSVACIRFLLRSFPIKSDGTKRKVLARWMIFCIVFTLLIIVAIFSALRAIQQSESIESNPLFVLSIFVPFAFTCIACFSGVLYIHTYSFYYKKYPFVLYLRKFSSFSDRTIMDEVLKASPKGIPLLFPASPGNRPANWDPFLWSFSGLRLTKPLSSLPIQMRASDANWQEFIQHMIKETNIIVMDLSSVSKSLEWAIDTLSKYAKNKEIIWLIKESEKIPAHVSESEIYKKSHMVRYSLSFVSAIPGFLWRLLISAYISYMVFGLLTGFKTLETLSGSTVELIISILLLFILFILFYSRLGISRESRWRIRIAIIDAVKRSFS